MSTKNIPSSTPEEKPYIDPQSLNVILEIRAGSHAYGTNIASSDVDTRGIFCAPQKELITRYNYIDEIEGKEPDDYRYYELFKFTSLLAEQNPNIMEILWTQGQDVIKTTPAGEYLQSERDKLLSKKVAKSYVEYAVSQMRRIKGHNKMLMKPQPEEAPQIKDFAKIRYNFTDNKEYNKSVPESGYVIYPSGGDMWAAFSLDKFKEVYPSYRPHPDLFDERGVPRGREKQEFGRIKEAGLRPDILFDINMETYKDKFEEWKKYWHWLKNRNPVRSEIEQQFGFDTKHAMHTIRLLRSGYEILTQNRVNVKRPDAKELISIREGAWSYERLLEEVAAMQEKVGAIVDKSTLPDRVDRELIANITFETYERAWSTPKLHMAAQPKTNAKP